MRELLDRHPDYLLVFVYGFEAHAEDQDGNRMDPSLAGRAAAARRIREWLDDGRGRVWVLIDAEPTISVQRQYGALANSVFFIDGAGVVRVKEQMADLTALGRKHEEFR